MTSRLQSDALRAALDLPVGFDPRKHWDQLQVIRQQHPHTIKFILFPPEGNCITCALDLIDKPAYRNAEIAASGKLARPPFVKWLLDNWLEEVTGPDHGCLALYFDNDTWRHIGVVSGKDRVTSMWGTFPVYDHQVWEVPSQYGNQLRFFKKLQTGAGLDLVLKYARGNAARNS